jgi:hypothetical protein
VEVVIVAVVIAVVVVIVVLVARIWRSGPCLRVWRPGPLSFKGFLFFVVRDCLGGEAYPGSDAFDDAIHCELKSRSTTMVNSARAMGCKSATIEVDCLESVI